MALGAIPTSKGEATPAVCWRCQATTTHTGGFMKFDESLQLEILRRAMDSAPISLEPHDYIEELVQQWDEHDIAATVMYLQRHGLIETGTQMGIGGYISWGYIDITHKGIDFMRPDGGLGALLNVVTVRLHEDSIKALFIDRINKSTEPDSVKKSLSKQVRDLPAEGLKTLTTTALQAALTHLPDAMSLLHKWLGHQ